MSFKALLAIQAGGHLRADLVDFREADLDQGDVMVAVEWSTVNDEDGVALDGAMGIIRRFPLIPGIDCAGVVESSSRPDFESGDRVVTKTWGLSQIHRGGYAQKARLPGAWLVKLPEGISTRDAMAIGTAGHTAMPCVLALEHGGLTPDRDDVLVTGAKGGVGSVATILLAKLGYRVVASTGRLEEEAYLRDLGAAEILDNRILSEPGAPIADERWAGAVDSVGGATLANVLAQTAYRGVVAACGLAQSADLAASAPPFILRNVTLAGLIPSMRRRPSGGRLGAAGVGSRFRQARPNHKRDWPRRGSGGGPPHPEGRDPRPHFGRRQRLKGGRIFAQLWHVGRVSHVDLHDGEAPVAPSAIRAETRTFVNDGFAEVSEPRALETAEIAGVVEDFRKTAANAVKAGFDGVEAHGANGYLIDQFLRSSSNLRADAC